LRRYTKEKEHDRPIALLGIVSEGWMEQEDLDYCVAKTLEAGAYTRPLLCST
jgi:hypothetical protein